MVGKISQGNFFGGAIDYAKDKNKSVKIDSNMMSNSNKDLTKEFLLCANLNTRVKKKVKHFVISFSAEDETKLNPELMQNLTKDYLQKMGYANNQFVAYLHQDTSKEHLHIIANRVDFDGEAVSDSFDKKRSRASLMKLEQKYNLTRTREKSLDKSKNYNKDEKEMIKRMKNKGKLTDKQVIKNVIITALERGVKNKNEFEKSLNADKIKLKENKAGNGYNFEFNDQNYKASSIDRNLSFAKIQESFKNNTQIFEKEQQQQREREENNFRGLER